jgi:hypothetical protein
LWVELAQGSPNSDTSRLQTVETDPLWGTDKKLFSYLKLGGLHLVGTPTFTATGVTLDPTDATKLLVTGCLVSEGTFLAKSSGAQAVSNDNPRTAMKYGVVQAASGYLVTTGDEAGTC